MAKYIIEGGTSLRGKINLSGNKNAILPALSACLLTDQEMILRNVPNISDVDIFLEIFKDLGAEVERGDHLVKIRCKEVKKALLPEEKVGKIRASILLVGPLLAKFGKVEFSHPGGDVIGKRHIETHLEAFESLGFKFKIEDRHYKGFAMKDRQKKLEIFLSEASVTATENLLLACSLGSQTVVLKNCAREPHVVDLSRLLVKMGAKIEGIGGSTLKIVGVPKLDGADWSIGSDYIEFGTYAIAAASTKGEIEIGNISSIDLQPVIFYLAKMGLEFEQNDDWIKIKVCSPLTSIPKLCTNLWPGFPTDLMSVVIVLATQAKGVTLCHDWMYESRMFFVDKLINMGAKIIIADPHRVLVYGPTTLYGRNMESPDIRAGMALVLAALVAKGRSIINKAELIERGYEDVVGKLSSLGVSIQRVD
jgi:UDP-N-acetylglucosamine 1-carboxyvinyltransferase